MPAKDKDFIIRATRTPFIADEWQMNFWDFTRGTASVRLLVAFGEEHGIAPSTLLAGTRLSPAQLVDPNVELLATQELAVIRNLIHAMKRPAGLGLQVGMRYHFSTYGIWGYGLVSSATAGDALALALRFMPLTYAFTRVAYRETGDLVVVNFIEPDVEQDLRDFLVERDMAAAVVLLREVAGQAFQLARFAIASRPGQISRVVPVLEQMLGVRPEFGATANSLAFDRQVLRLPLPQADPTTYSMCRQMCAQLLERRKARLGTAALVRQYLDVSVEASSLAHLARVMNTSERTLKRRLKAEGTSFRILLAESRGELAKEMLKDDTLTLTDIADKLGFSDLSSFSQAFKRWFGQSPGSFRKSDPAAS